MTYLKGQGSGLLKFKGQGPEMVNVEECRCRRPYPKNVHQPWPLALKWGYRGRPGHLNPNGRCSALGLTSSNDGGVRWGAVHPTTRLAAQ